MKFRIGINNPMSEQYFYYETDWTGQRDNPFEERGELAATGHVTFRVSKDEDMSNTFWMTVSPSNCSYITIEEMEE